MISFNKRSLNKGQVKHQLLSLKTICYQKNSSKLKTIIQNSKYQESFQFHDWNHLSLLSGQTLMTHVRESHLTNVFINTISFMPFINITSTQKKLWQKFGFQNYFEDLDAFSGYSNNLKKILELNWCPMKMCSIVCFLQSVKAMHFITENNIVINFWLKVDSLNFVWKFSDWGNVVV